MSNHHVLSGLGKCHDVSVLQKRNTSRLWNDKAESAKEVFTLITLPNDTNMSYIQMLVYFQFCFMFPSVRSLASEGLDWGVFDGSLPVRLVEILRAANIFWIFPVWCGRPKCVPAPRSHSLLKWLSWWGTYPFSSSDTERLTLDRKAASVGVNRVFFHDNLHDSQNPVELLLSSSLLIFLIHDLTAFSLQVASRFDKTFISTFLDNITH